MSHFFTQIGSGLRILFGLMLFILGGYLFFEHLNVLSSWAALWGQSNTLFGLVLLVIGFCALTLTRRKLIGVLLVIAGLAWIFVQVSAHLVIVYRPTTFFETVLILFLIFSGLGVVGRAMIDRL